MTVTERFISPYEDAAPAGAEGWEELYPYYLTFRPERREIEEGKFWFADLAHWPRVFKPFDTIMVEFAAKCLGQYNTRHYLVPPANGIDYRVHNGYTYMNPVAVPESEIPARVPQFLARAGHYFANWPTLLENWERKMRRVIADLEAISFEPLPDRVAMEDIVGGAGHDPHLTLTENYNRAVELADHLGDLAVPVGQQRGPVGEVVPRALEELGHARGDLLLRDAHRAHVEVAVVDAVVDPVRGRDHPVARVVLAEAATGELHGDRVERLEDARPVLEVGEPELRLLDVAAVLAEVQVVGVEFLPALRLLRRRIVVGADEPFSGLRRHRSLLSRPAD